MTALPVVLPEDRTIFFSKSNDPFGEFSNFYAGLPFVLYGQEWATSEHCYQAMKFLDPATREHIRTQPNAFMAAKEGRDPKHLLRDDWDVVKEPIMGVIIEAKVTQHRRVMDLLVATEDCFLAEYSNKDMFWGTRRDLQGYNRLGFLFMHLRDKLRWLYYGTLPFPGD